jgi:hypothetical protein
MRRALKIAAMIAIGIALGLAATWATAVRGTMSGGVSDGPWSTSLDTGSSESGLYLRARVAVHGLLALSREETVYYSALRDSNGADLVGNCIYRLEGRDLPTRWWSITAYGADDFLIPNDANLYSISKNSVARNPNGSFAVTLSQAKANGNWIPVAPGRFNLTIRLYNPDHEVIADPAHVALPKISKEICE